MEQRRTLSAANLTPSRNKPERQSMPDSTPDISSAASASTPVVSIKDVTHRYGGTLALDGISLDIPSGRMVGMIGPDGVGKSTLMALIAGSKQIQQGKVIVLDGDM